MPECEIIDMQSIQSVPFWLIYGMKEYKEMVAIRDVNETTNLRAHLFSIDRVVAIKMLILPFPNI